MVISRFTNSTYVKDKIGGIIGNVDDSSIAATILRAQDFYIGTILNYKSCNYYYELMERNENETLTTQEQELITYYIQPALAEWTYYLLCGEISNRLTNKGVIQEGYEKGNPADKDNKVLKDYEIKAMAIHYTDIMKNYLFCNRTYFPTLLFPEEYTKGLDNNGGIVTGKQIGRAHV